MRRKSHGILREWICLKFPKTVFFLNCRDGSSRKNLNRIYIAKEWGLLFSWKKGRVHFLFLIKFNVHSDRSRLITQETRWFVTYIKKKSFSLISLRIFILREVYRPISLYFYVCCLEQLAILVFSAFVCKQKVPALESAYEHHVFHAERSILYFHLFRNEIKATFFLSLFISSRTKS